MSVRSTLRGRVATTVAAGAGVALVMMAAGCDKAKDAADTATSAAGSAVSTATDKASSAVASATNGAGGDSTTASSGANVPPVLQSPTASAPPAPVVASTSIASPQGGQVSLTDPAIVAEYASRGYEKGYLGKPLGPVADLPGGGKFLTLQGGSIYLNPTTKKAYSVHGAIGGYWGDKGHEKSALGYPNGEETPVDGGLSQSFDNGTLIDTNGTVTQK